MPSTYSWNDNFILTFKTDMIWFLNFVLNTIKISITEFPKYLPTRIYIKFHKKYYSCRGFFQFYYFQLECWLCSHFYFIFAMNTDKAENQAEIILLNQQIVILPFDLWNANIKQGLYQMKIVMFERNTLCCFKCL